MRFVPSVVAVAVLVACGAPSQELVEACASGRDWMNAHGVASAGEPGDERLQARIDQRLDDFVAGANRSGHRDLAAAASRVQVESQRQTTLIDRQVESGDDVGQQLNESLDAHMAAMAEIQEVCEREADIDIGFRPPPIDRPRS